ncbi:class I SAM-dependent methyltransferase [Paenibacillus sp. IHBB 10380]|uniref:class I SAM-dependent methyltransferase n=1 Tax=Paenibacillus sp. IHBB 10380 TaxID=1566358 RepID=UPI0005CFE4B9|nr:methyltransferase domain-containing protein [Paenibacillus sp. IHBB 10380]AJS58624.1 methyltransferase type 11 [Paenibacillus sp. IHBB 10380]
MEKEKLIRIFDNQASMYDKRRKKLSDRKWREPLVSCAYGKVLEVSVGAGANFPFYPNHVEVTAVDFSNEMLLRAQVAAADTHTKAEFIHADVESLSFPNDTFDTIVSTLSFCGYENPSSVLALFTRWCKPNGQILLMEHGVSSKPIIRKIQNLVNPMFRKTVGCHLNRDIMGMLQKADLKLERVEHHWMNMVHLILARPNK